MPYESLGSIDLRPLSYATAELGASMKYETVYFKNLLSELDALFITPEEGDSLRISHIDWRNREGEFWPTEAVQGLNSAQGCRAIICSLFKGVNTNKWCARVCPIEGPMQGRYVIVYNDEVTDIRKKEGESR